LPPERPELFHDYLRAILSATYHRTIQAMSSPKDVVTLYEAAKWASENTDLGGHVEWIIPNRMFVWRGANVYNIDTSQLRFIGIGRTIERGRVTTRATIIMRVGWYKMHLAVARALGLSPKRFPS